MAKFLFLMLGLPGDPNAGDTVLGKAGGLRYSRESQPFTTNGSFAAAEAGCGGAAWHDVGGGTRLPIGTGETIDVDEAYLTESMMEPTAKIVAGFQPVMPSFQGKIAGPEVAALVEYIKSLQSDVVRTGPSEGPAYAPIRGR